MVIQNLTLIFFMYLVNCFPIQNADGVYLVYDNGQKIEFVSSKADFGYMAFNHLVMFYKQPKRYYTSNEKIHKIKSFSKVLLQGSEFDSNTMKNIGLIEMEKISKPMIYNMSGNRVDMEYIYKQKEGEWDKSDIVKKFSKSNFQKEININGTLSKNVVYALWINGSYYMFEIN